MIVAAIGLCYQLAQLTPLGGIRPMNLNFCFNRSIIRFLGPNEFKFLFDCEVVHLFTLPNHERTSLHSQKKLAL